MIEYLETELINSLNEAKSILIAVALLKKYGLEIIEDNIPEYCSRKYLVGINLPTPPYVLRRLLELQETNIGQVSTKIYETNKNFHPKVYLIEKKSGKLIAFIGSANATQGGFMDNIEMSVKVIDQKQCLEILNWFDKKFTLGRNFDSNYINSYEIVFKRNNLLASTIKSNIANIGGEDSSLSTNNLVIKPGQFFRQSDFDAFAPDTQFNTTPRAVELRGEVRERLIELNELIQKDFSKYGITDLHLPNRRNHYTSQHFHSRGNNHIPKEAIWLQYGKSREELLLYSGKFYQSFVNHIRLQVILKNTVNEVIIGIWLYLSKAHSSYFDRKRLKDGLNEIDFVERLYEYILALGGAYWIWIGNTEKSIAKLENSSELVEFLLQDDYSQEFIIGRDYAPNDTELSEDNIGETVIIEFAKLYKIYALIKAPLNQIR